MPSAQTNDTIFANLFDLKWSFTNRGDFLAISQFKVIYPWRHIFPLALATVFSHGPFLQLEQGCWCSYHWWTTIIEISYFDISPLRYVVKRPTCYLSFLSPAHAFPTGSKIKTSILRSEINLSTAFWKNSSRRSHTGKFWIYKLGETSWYHSLLLLILV